LLSTRGQRWGIKKEFPSVFTAHCKRERPEGSGTAGLFLAVAVAEVCCLQALCSLRGTEPRKGGRGGVGELLHRGMRWRPFSPGAPGSGDGAHCVWLRSTACAAGVETPAQACESMERSSRFLLFRHSANMSSFPLFLPQW